MPSPFTPSKIVTGVKLTPDLQDIISKHLPSTATKLGYIPSTDTWTSARTYVTTAEIMNVNNELNKLEDDLGVGVEVCGEERSHDALLSPLLPPLVIHYSSALELEIDADADAGGSSKTQAQTQKLQVHNRRTVKEQQSYDARIARLSRRTEEAQYSGMTHNLKVNYKEGAVRYEGRRYDDNNSNSNGGRESKVTSELDNIGNTTAIALNMIIAPICFGAFIYFFAGSVFTSEREESEESGNEKRINTTLVVVSVLGGIAMLFVEMVLFVIRSDAMITHDRKKKKRADKKKGSNSDLAKG